jgi:2-keto-3-deoxy-L-rhamnonate aldolase RhmA
MTSDPHATFRRRFAAREPLIGTFIKTPTTHAIEILGEVGFDFVVIDEEHAPFDRAAVDTALFAARASGTAGFVRILSPSPGHLLSVLDCGATGVLVPHVASAKLAQEVALACRYRDGRRGYSGSTRAGRYGGSKMWDTIDAADAAVTVIAQIEDREAIDEIDAIAATDGIHGLFIGRSDLSVAFGAASSDAPQIREAVEKIAAAARRAGKPICVFVGTVKEAESLREQGASAFVVSSDQGFMRRAASQALFEIGAVARGTAGPA